MLREVWGPSLHQGYVGVVQKCGDVTAVNVEYVGIIQECGVELLGKVKSWDDNSGDRGRHHRDRNCGGMGT